MTWSLLGHTIASFKVSIAPPSLPKAFVSLNSGSMNRSLSMPPANFDDAAEEARPLLYDMIERRLYQPYCVTEASSRPPTPDLFLPQPLRICPDRLSRLDVNVQPGTSPKVTPDTSLVQSTASSPARCVGSPALLKAENEGKRQTTFTNESLLSRDTTSEISNHITRTVTARDSHSLASDGVTRCDQPTSHPRMQQLVPFNSALCRTIPRKPISRLDEDTEKCHHSLPRLPRDVVTTTKEHTYVLGARAPTSSVNGFEQVQEPWTAPTYHISENTFLLSHGPNNGSERPLSERYDRNRQFSARLSAQSIAVKGEIESQILAKPLCNVVIRDWPTVSSPNHASEDYAQIPSSAALYARGHLADLHDNRLAHRRTRPKDANLRYQFGELPSRNTDLPLLTPIHRDLYNGEYSTQSAPSPSIHSSIATLAGPRPPPWGSYDDLEMRRWKRGDARERAQVLAYRRQLDAAPILYRGPQSIESLNKVTPRREVDVFEEEIRSVYPDMEFDMDTARGGWCCRVM